MTPDEVAQFYSWAASADSRLEELDQADLFAWSQILHEVPFADGRSSKGCSQLSASTSCSLARCWKRGRNTTLNSAARSPK